MLKLSSLLIPFPNILLKIVFIIFIIGSSLAYVAFSYFIYFSKTKKILTQEEIYMKFIEQKYGITISDKFIYYNLTENQTKYDLEVDTENNVEKYIDVKVNETVVSSSYYFNFISQISSLKVTPFRKYSLIKSIDSLLSDLAFLSFLIEIIDHTGLQIDEINEQHHSPS